MEIKNPKSHVTLVAALHIGFGILTVIGGIILFVVLNFASGFIEEYDEVAIQVMTAISTVIPLGFLIFGGIDVLAGIALFSYQQWSRVLVIIISALNCLNVPIGTAKGVYSIWALMQHEVMELFE
jgi:hypothetical protein